MYIISKDWLYMNKEFYTLGIDIGSTTVKIAILDTEHTILFSDYKRHYANICLRTLSPGLAIWNFIQ